MGVLIAALLQYGPALILPIIKGVEAAFGRKTGEVKSNSVLEALRPIIEKLAAAGKLPGLPDDLTLKTAIEAIFQQHKNEIETGTPGTSVTTTEPHSLSIPPGSIITIQYPSVQVIPSVPEVPASPEVIK